MGRSRGLKPAAATTGATGLPEFMPVSRQLRQAPLPDVAAAVRRAVGTRARECHGRKVAVAVGSRGIDGLPQVVAVLVGLLREAGASPFIVPAMGSHGGAHPAGQVGVLATRGITPKVVGADIVGDDAGILLGHDLPFSRAALAADLIVPVNRVKAHTILEGDQGSGLRKMSVVGLGLAAGAAAAHAAGLAGDLERRFEEIRSRAPLAWGLALVEDGTGCLAGVTAAEPAEFGSVDRRLLATAREFSPGLGFSNLDALVLIQMGKEISGAGMDPDVIGRHRRRGDPLPPGSPWIGVLRLGQASGGNAIGVGMADLVSARLTGAMDRQVTAANATASGWEAGARVPAVAATDAALLAAACRSQRRRLVIALDTAHLGRLLVSPALAEEVADRQDLEAMGPPVPLPLDDDGNLEIDLLPL
jgi:hypothetical protein